MCRMSKGEKVGGKSLADMWLRSVERISLLRVLHLVCKTAAGEKQLGGWLRTGNCASSALLRPCSAPASAVIAAAPIAVTFESKSKAGNGLLFKSSSVSELVIVSGSETSGADSSTSELKSSAVGWSVGPSAVGGSQAVSSVAVHQ